MSIEWKKNKEIGNGAITELLIGAKIKVLQSCFLESTVRITLSSLILHPQWGGDAHMSLHSSWHLWAPFSYLLGRKLDDSSLSHSNIQWIVWLAQHTILSGLEPLGKEGIRYSHCPFVWTVQTSCASSLFLWSATFFIDGMLSVWWSALLSYMFLDLVMCHQFRFLN